ncbi:hypothetical protein F4780DRAFT_793371 [Xylariomycetidae sp. FL0641]|nr:hypothetical protein F4780DRAFT_793371 [Xylariomycetidae sp. FL0641]
MPLHLLGKKSWNVYNRANIERVRRDEAAAAAREEAEEQRQNEYDAARRLAILRGETPPPPPEPAAPEASRDPAPRGDRAPRSGSERRKRKRHGEDDTDFEMRVARERARDRDDDDDDAAAASARKPQGSSDAPLLDARGHIDLFPADAGAKNADAEREAAAARRALEDQYTMRFTNAAGHGADPRRGPWYAVSGEAPAQKTDAFGKPDARRGDRDAARAVASDPLAMMRRGAAKVREVEAERRAANAERERESRALRKEERRAERRRRREGRENDPDELEGFIHVVMMESLTVIVIDITVTESALATASAVGIGTRTMGPLRNDV